jgi:hypothetical protein
MAGGLATLVLAACGDDGGSPASAPPSTTTTTAGAAGTGTTAVTSAPPVGATGFTAADFDGIGTCVLLPEQTPGPFPLEEQFDRRDITEGVDGRSMRLGFRVVDPGCAPIQGAAVEVWHCDATGDYSAFTDGGGGKDDAAGTTYLRGTQTAGADGIVEFATIVPGWYPGRAVHVHLRVHVDDDVVLTSQVYFDPEFLSAVYGEPPYAEFGEPDTSNGSDGIAGDPEGDGTLLSSTLEGPGGTALALLNLGVAPA